jgi:pimeloyl-ACP methyl ester carboxylesterase
MAKRRRIRGALVDDVSLPVDGADPLEAFVVHPGAGSGPDSGAGPRAAVLWLHWLGEHHNDRSQFLGEAVALAARGVRSVLPAGRLPWMLAPKDAAADVAAIELEQRRLDSAYDALIGGLPATTPVALVGHDFGAMHGLGLLARTPRVRSAVLIAGVPRWADWFRPFWPIETDEIAYRAALLPHDPVRRIAETKANLLLQFSRNDFYIPQFWGRELARATGRELGAGVALEVYAADHAMRSAKARASRTAFLERSLELA